MEAFIITVVIILAIALFLIFAYFQNNRPDITEYSITADIEKDKTIVHLSDFHSKPSKIIFEKVKEINPDIICITGDFINDKGRRREAMLQYAKKLCEIADVIYIPGNHERRLADFDTLMTQLRKSGFCVLIDSICTDQGITFLGLDENQADFKDYKARKNGTYKYKDSSALLKRFSKIKGFKILLSHFPENFKAVKENNYQQYDFDLQLSGHAHGGQWILPFVGPVFSPGQGLFPKYARGSFGERPKLIISRGIGNAEFPLRLFNHPEIIVINLKEKSENA